MGNLFEIQERVDQPGETSDNGPNPREYLAIRRIYKDPPVMREPRERSWPDLTQSERTDQKRFGTYVAHENPRKIYSILSSKRRCNLRNAIETNGVPANKTTV